MISVLRTLPLLILLSLSLAPGCTSRYRLDLFVSGESNPNARLKIEGTELIHDAAPGDPYARTKIVPGPQNLGIVTASTRWQDEPIEGFHLVSFDRYWTARIYLALPAPVSAGNWEVSTERTYLHLLGHYEWDEREKIFLPDSGSYAIDSVSGETAYFTLAAVYRNEQGKRLLLDGRFKMKIER